MTVLLAVCIIFSMVPATVFAAENVSVPDTVWADYAVEKFEGGTGTETDPIQIATAEQLAKLSNDVKNGRDYCGQYFILTDDIDLSAHRWVPIGIRKWASDDNVTKSFRGFLDGNNKTITGLFVDERVDKNAAGFFGCIEDRGSEIVGAKDLTILGANIYADETGLENLYAGILAGYVTANSGEVIYFENITVSGNVTVTGTNGYNNIGGMIGSGTRIEAINCKAVDISVSGASNSGGFIGLDQGSTYEDCEVSGKVDGTWTLGGFVGYITGEKSRFYDCKAQISSVTGTGNILGGFVGLDEIGSTYIGCEVSGKDSGICEISVTGNDLWGLGGFVGYAATTNSGFENCKATNISVSGANTSGGFVGSDKGSDYKNCEVSGKLEGTWTLGGFAGYTSGEQTSFTGCKAKISSITGTGNQLGGFVGCDANGSTYTSCEVSGKDSGICEISGTGTTDPWGRGGFVGYASTANSSFVNCKATNISVSGANTSGGFVGSDKGSDYTSCEVSGKIDGTWTLGGFAGYTSGDPSGFTGCKAEISSITSNSSQLGGFVGCDANGSTYEDCEVSGKDTGNCVISGAGTYQWGRGGFAGYASTANSSFENCKATNISIVGANYSGGFVGQDMGSDYKNCEASGAINGAYTLGGFVGYTSTLNTTNQSSFDTCNANVKITGNNWRLGGFVGYAVYGEFKNCVAQGDVTSTFNHLEANVGGFIGQSDNATVKDCLAKGKVTYYGSGVNSTGGFIGYYKGGTFDNCYFDHTKNSNLNATGTGSLSSGVQGIDTSDDNMCTSCFSGHLYRWAIDTEPTCTTDGSKSQHCIYCGNQGISGVPISAAHDYSTEWTIDTAATCTTEGSKSHHCTRCGDKKDITPIPAAHVYSYEWTIDTPATCTTNGSKSHHCIYCGDKEDITAIPAAHDYTTEWTIDTAVTCTTNGSKSHHCILCGHPTDITLIQAEGHDLIKTEAKAATHIEEGYEAYWTCEKCGELFSDENGVTEITSPVTISKIEHNYSHELTFNETGHWYATTCGHDNVTGALDIQPHTFGEWTVTTEATEDATGLKERSCECGYKETEVIDKLASTTHTTHVKDNGTRVEPTCENKGSITYKCTECGEVMEVVELAALGHNYTSQVTTEPTTESEGVRTYTCDRCGHSYTSPIDKLQDTDNQPEDNQPEDNQPEDNQPEDNQPEDNQPEDNQPEDNQPEDSEQEDSEQEGNQPEGNRPEGNQQEGNRPEGNQQEGNRPEGNQQEGNQPEGNRQEDNQPETNQPATSQPGTNQPTVENRPDTGMPYIRDEVGKVGWDTIKAEADKYRSGDILVVEMNGSTAVPGDVLDEIKGRDITLVFDMGNGISWSVNGQSITADKIGDIDFDVKVDTDVIPTEIINNVASERYNRQISLTYDGEFGFIAVLSIDMDKANAGLYANLFYYNGQTGELEFICADEIAADGTAELTFTHASDYAIVADKEIMDGSAETGGIEAVATETVTTQTGAGHDTAGNPWWIIAAGALVIVIGAGVFFAVKKRE